MKSLPSSLSWIIPSPRHRVSVLPEDEINNHDHVGTHVHDKAHDPNDEDEDKDEDDSTLPETEDNRSWDYILSHIPEDDQ